ncbi:MAG TPA: DUF5658 family protein [Noviherbaspirillum sp.]|nr:DUF5658 family protein [Noviherbaspirillum sp.]
MNLCLFVVLVLLQIADVCTTWHIIRSGIGHEANRLIARIIDDIGLLPGLVLPKVLVMVPAYMSAITPLDVRWVDLTQTGILAALVLFYVWVVANNVRVIRRAGRR